MNDNQLSAFAKKQLVRLESNSDGIETWFCPEDEGKRIAEEMDFYPNKSPMSLVELLTKMKEYPFKGKTRKYFVGHCILLMRTLHRCCKIKEKITDIVVFKMIISYLMGMPYGDVLKLLQEAVAFVYSEQNLGKYNIQKPKPPKVEQATKNVDKQIRIQNASLKKPFKNSSDEIPLRLTLERLERAIKCERFTCGPKNEQVMSLKAMVDEMNC